MIMRAASFSVMGIVFGMIRKIDNGAYFCLDVIKAEGSEEKAILLKFCVLTEKVAMALRLDEL